MALWTICTYHLLRWCLDTVHSWMQTVCRAILAIYGNVTLLISSNSTISNRWLSRLIKWKTDGRSEKSRALAAEFSRGWKFWAVIETRSRNPAVGNHLLRRHIDVIISTYVKEDIIGNKHFVFGFMSRCHASISLVTRVVMGRSTSSSNADCGSLTWPFVGVYML